MMLSPFQRPAACARDVASGSRFGPGQGTRCAPNCTGRLAHVIPGTDQRKELLTKVTPGGDAPSELWKPRPAPDPVDVMLANTIPVAPGDS